MAGKNDNFNGVTGNNIRIRTIHIAPIKADVGAIFGNISLN